MTEQGTTLFDKYSLHFVVLVGALIVGAAIYFGGGKAPAAPTGGEPQAQEVDIKKVKTAGQPYVGSPTAPVTMAVWIDYQCSWCKRFELQTLSRLESEYVATGKLRIVYKDFPFQGPDSTNTALFARAMWEAYPQHFPAWFKAVAGLSEESMENIKALAAAIPGVDAERVARLMSEKQVVYQAAIDADYAEGSAFGIMGTPGSIVGTTYIDGAKPYEEVKAIIDAELR